MPTEWTPELQAKVSQMIAAGCNSGQIAEAINLSKTAVFAGNKRHNLGTFEVGHKAEIPENLAKLWADHSIRELAVMFSKRRETIARWGATLGLPKKMPRDTAKARLTNNLGRKRPVSRGSGFVRNNVSYKPDRPAYDESQAGQAARYLQRYGAVYRCDQFGKANPAGKFWNRGGRVLSDADVISRADFMRRKDAA